MWELENAVVRLSVIIPTIGRRLDLERCLTAIGESAALLRSTAVQIDVVIAADGCMIKAQQTSANLPVHIISIANRIGAQAARQIACRESCADIFSFLDDDALPRGDWLQVIIDRLAQGAGAITGRVLPMDSSLLSRARQARYDQRYAPLSDNDPVEFFAGGNSAIEADLFRECGGFSVLKTGGDNSLCISLRRLRHHVRFAPDLVVVHRHDKGFRSAIAASATAGLAHPQRLSTASALCTLTASSPGDDIRVRVINRGLAGINTLARTIPRRTEGSSSVLDD
jgi:glycosyltransferase involved in cell wall biosynthesis